MVGVACGSLVDIESLILRSALRGRFAASQGEIRTGVEMFHVKQAAADEI